MSDEFAQMQTEETLKGLIMEDKQLGNTMLYASIAMLAGVVGSVATLFITNNQTTELQISDRARAEFAVSRTKASSDSSNSSDLHDASANGQLQFDQKLQEIMDQASAERSQLADSIRDLTIQLEDLESDMINQLSLSALDQISVDDDAASDQSTGQGVNGSELANQTQAEKRLSGLVAAGVNLQIAQEIQASQDRFQLSRLELFDQAEREGWIDSDEFSDQLEQLEEQRPDLREELGDAAYDRYLFELGRNNRVAIASVIGGSAADLAGLQSGDTIFSYANQRVFSTRELQSATRQGQRGEYVPMLLMRSGQSLSAQIPRGPLGVTLTAIKSEPS